LSSSCLALALTSPILQRDNPLVKPLTGRKNSSRWQRDLKSRWLKARRCLSCGLKLGAAEERLCAICSAKESDRKAKKRSDLIREERCPECGEKGCYDAWLISPTISPVARQSPLLARNTCVKKLFKDLGNPKARKTKKQKEILGKYPHIGEIFKQYGYPGLLNEITHEMLGVLAPPKKSAIRRWKEETHGT
jgi:hypothetical protein